MATATKKKPTPVIIPKPEAPKTAKQQVADALETYFSRENAVHATHLLDGEIEITTARERLFEVLAGVDLEVPEVELEDVLHFLKTSTPDEDKRILEEFHNDSLLEAVELEDEDCTAHLSDSGWVLVKTESLLQRNKLEEFLRTEIWTTDGLYNQNVIL